MGKQELMVIGKVNRTALEEEASGFILFSNQVAHPTTADLLDRTESIDTSVESLCGSHLYTLELHPSWGDRC